MGVEVNYILLKIKLKILSRNDNNNHHMIVATVKMIIGL